MSDRPTEETGAGQPRPGARPVVDWPVSATALAGVIGFPARHSLSPRLHNAAFAAMGLDWCYAAFEVPPPLLARAVAGAGALGLRGLSVTMPHKEGAARLATRHSREVRRLGAANTLIFEGASIRAENCDGSGLLDDLAAGEGFDPVGRRCGVIGAGGAARAIVLALAEAGASEIVVVNRTAVRAWRAIALAPKLARVGRPEEMKAMDLVVQATPVGMGPPGTGPGPRASQIAPKDELTGSNFSTILTGSNRSDLQVLQAGSVEPGITGQSSPSLAPSHSPVTRPASGPSQPGTGYGGHGVSQPARVGGADEEAGGDGPWAAPDPGAPGPGELGRVVAGVDPSWFGPGQLVVDIIYNTFPTPFLADAMHHGAHVRGGLGMLVHQAGCQIALWTGMAPPLDVMWEAAGGSPGLLHPPG